MQWVTRPGSCSYKVTRSLDAELCGAEMMIMVIMMMGDDQDMGLDPGQRRSVFSPQCVQIIDVQHCVQCTAAVH